MIPLTQEELKRARALQRKLRWLRRWDRIGRVFCWPWTFYKARQQQMLRELTDYYERWKLSQEPEVRPLRGKPPSFVDAFHQSYFGNPLTIRKAKEEIFRTLNSMRSLATGVEQTHAQ